MEEEIKSAFSNADVKLNMGSGGDFIVKVDDKVIFSKNEPNLKRFPKSNEITKLLIDEGY